ncbi:RLA class II histocompatibility antigen, DP alpha-1 chain-like [Dryobates pubescens]|uniref:RLA class II histocompatibility antigen, DP alpha-1 chain-like n=1 Tax=Dryobates pubescens TaxID=118200 RepID=UPI000521994B|nr:RLA class II histocompatibility antigen, DP alpha-1 chain-like [Dryobates pubescens]
MAGQGGVLLVLLAVLTLPGMGAVKVKYTWIQACFSQQAERLQQEDGEFLFEFNEDEIFHVDLQAAEAIWRLPEFTKFTYFEAQGALQEIAVIRRNLEVSKINANYSQGTIAAPEVAVFSMNPVELGEPNMLICHVDKFWPSVLSISWLRNGQEVTLGVMESVFYLRDDNRFRKFSYLPFVPTLGDDYHCRVEHWGLSNHTLRHWDPQMPLSISESTETLVCALGLAVGIVGIVVGTILIIKAMKTNSSLGQRGVL